MTDPCKNNAFAGSEPGDGGGFSANQSKPWRHGEHSYSYKMCVCKGRESWGQRPNK